MSAKKWNFYYDEKQNKFTPDQLVDAASLWIAIGLLWLSFLRIIEEHFPKFLTGEIKVYDTHSYASASLVTKEVGLDWFVIILFLVCLWLPTSGFLPKDNKRWDLAAMIGSVLIPVWYIVSNHEELLQGLLSVARQYLNRFNPYQGTNLVVPMTENTGYAPIAFTLLLMLVWMVLWGASRLMKKRIVLVLFPVLAIMLEFLVGISPVGIGLSYMFVAAFLLLIPKGTNILKHGIVVVVTALSVFVAGFMFDEKIEELSSDNTKVLSLIENFQVPQINWENFLNFDFQINNETLDNHQPKYNGDTVFEITTNHSLQGNIYLRGYCATEYSNGNWYWDRSVFEAACEEYGYSESEVAQILSKTPYEALEQLKGFSKESKVTVAYVGSTGDTAYVPYMFDYESLDGEYTFYGDFLIKKGVFDTEVSTGSNYFGDTEELYQATHGAIYLDNYDMMRWYNEVAQEYTKSLTDMECIKESAEYIKSTVNEYTEMNLMLSSIYVEYDDTTLSDVLTNINRVVYAKRIANYLAINMSYSVILDDLPWGADPVEYALAVGHEGYCMHYASAGALILRELGIPSRYVSGYVVRPSDFAWDAENSIYKAEISDYSSHAWVEIYLENIGWVPIEMTEGYSSSGGKLPTMKDPNYWEDISEENRQNFDSETEEVPTETETETESETETETEEIVPPTERPQLPTESEDPQSSESQSEDSESEGNSENSELNNPNNQGPGFGGFGTGENAFLEGVFFILKLLGIVLLVIAAILGVLFGIKCWKRHYAYILEREIKKNLTRRAVKRMNKRIYRTLRLRMPFIGYINDRKYEHALAQLYPSVTAEDWAMYMEIVKKTHYSLEDVSTEEMMHCYNCYQAR